MILDFTLGWIFVASLFISMLVAVERAAEERPVDIHIAKERGRLAAAEAIRIERALLDEYRYDITLKENQ